MDSAPLTPYQSLTEQDRNDLNGIADQLFSLENEGAMQMLQQLHAQVQAMPIEQVDAKKLYLDFVTGFWNYFQAFNEFTKSGNIPKAVELISVAHQWFSDFGWEDMIKVSKGLFLYFEGIEAFRNQNIGVGVKKLDEARSFMNEANRFSGHYKSFIDHLAPENNFAIAMQALMQLDYQNADIYSNKAYESSVKVARQYYEYDSEGYHSFMGLGHYYRAYYLLLNQINQFNQFNFDSMIFDKGEALAEAEKSIEHLSKGNLTDNVNIAASFYFSKASALLAEVTSDLANLMERLMTRKDDIEIKDFPAMKYTVSQASKIVAKAGPNSLIFIRFCQQIEKQVYSLERLLSQKGAAGVAINNKEVENKQIKSIDFEILRKVIAKGQSGKALDMLLNTVRSSDAFDQLVMLKGQWSVSEKKAGLNIEEPDIIDRTQSRITKHLLGLISQLEDDEA